MSLAKNKLLFWGIIIFIIGMIAAIFIPMTTMRGTMADTVTQLNEKYDDEFTMTWTSLDDTPMSDTFIAIVKSNRTGVTYDVVSTDGDAVLDYELENFNTDINNVVEAAIDNSFALAKTQDGQLDLRVLVTAGVTEPKVQELAEQLKADFALSSGTIEIIQIDQANFDMATEHISEYYQRSTVAADAFDTYEPIKTSYPMK